MTAEDFLAKIESGGTVPLSREEWEALAFVERRLEEYERMWDGCGVKIEYYEES